MAKNFFASPQEAAFEDLTKEILKAMDTRFSGLDQKLQEKYLGAASEIAKLQDRWEDSEQKQRQRFEALLNGHQKGGEYRGSFRSREEAANFGRLIAATIKGDHNAIQELQKAAIGGTTGEKGGFLIGEAFVDAVIYNVEQFGVFERNCPPIDVSSAGAQPKFTSGAMVYFPDEGVAPTESNFTFSQVKFSVTRYSAFGLVDRWMLSEPTAAALGDFVVTELGRALAKAQDSNAFMGDGTSTSARVSGAFKKAGTNQLVVAGDAGDTTFQKIIDKTTFYLAKMIGGLPEWVEMFDPKWFMHRSIFWQYMGVRDSQGRPIADILNMGGKPQRVLMGYPVEVTQVAPKLTDTAVSKTMAIFGALQAGWRLFRHKNKVELRVSEHYKFLEGQTAFCLDVLQDIVEADNQAYEQLQTAAS